MLNLSLSKRAKEFLEELPKKQYKQVTSRTLDLLREPRPQDRRPIKGAQGYYRIDVGEYRVVYRFDTSLVSVAFIDSRNDDRVYDRLERVARGPMA
jgi:mRNA interferase RelE/StbE